MYTKQSNAISALKLWLTVVLCMMIFGGAAFITRTAPALIMHSRLDPALSSPWTAVTYMWIHADIWHLLVNAAILGLFIYAAIGILSRTALIVIFLTGGICGAVSYVAYSHFVGLPYSMLTGASAAILAVGAALTAASPRATVTFGAVFRVNVCLLTIPVMLFMGIVSSIDTPGSLSAHCGGIASGIIAGLIYSGYKHQSKQTAVNTDEQTRLLDKVRCSGYSSLSQSERIILNRITKN